MTRTERDPETLEAGEVLTDFHGDRWEFVRWDGHKAVVRPYGSDTIGRERTFYAGVVGIRDPRLPDADA